MAGNDLMQLRQEGIWQQWLKPLPKVNKTELNLN